MLEKEIQRTVNDYLDMVLVRPKKGWYYHTHESAKVCYKCNSVIAPGHGGIKGIPDIIGGVKSDRGMIQFALELKRKGKKPNKHQLEQLQYLEERGVITGYADSIDSAISFFEKIMEVSE